MLLGLSCRVSMASHKQTGSGSDDQASYGLRQSPRLWFAYLRSTLTKTWFECSCFIDCLFKSRDTSSLVLIVAYFDELFVIELKIHAVDAVKRIADYLTVIALDQCSYFFGIKLNHRDNELLRSKGIYMWRLLHSTRMLDCKAARTPLPHGHSLYRERTRLWKWISIIFNIL